MRFRLIVAPVVALSAAALAVPATSAPAVPRDPAPRTGSVITLGQASAPT